MLISDLSSEQLLMLIIPALPNMWALKHAMYHDFPTTQEKYRWMMACVFLPCVAGVAYYFVGRKHASKEKVDIRARMEAERARREAEKAGAAPQTEEGAAPAAEGVALPVAEGAAPGVPSAETSAEEAAAVSLQENFSSQEFAEKEASAAPQSASAGTLPESSGREPLRGRPGKAAHTGDEWSFGCPDDVRKP